jgi:Homocysteine S-methyltransferase
VAGVANPLIERLRDGPPICCDGDMGSQITSTAPRLRCPEEANLRAPESVLSLHLGFIRSGAEPIETNSFGANRRKLWSYRLALRLHNEVPGIVVPESLQTELLDAGAGAAEIGVAHARPVRRAAGEGGPRLRRSAAQEASRCARRAPLNCYGSGA